MKILKNYIIYNLVLGSMICLSCHSNKSELSYNISGNSINELFEIESIENNILNDTAKIKSIESAKILFSYINKNNLFFLEDLRTQLIKKDSIINNAIIVDYIDYLKNNNPDSIKVTGYHSVLYGDFKSEKRVFLYEKEKDKLRQLQSFNIEREKEEGFKNLLSISAKYGLYKPPDSLIYREENEETLMFIKIISSNKTVNYFMFNPIQTNQYLWGAGTVSPKIRGAFIGTIMLLNSAFDLAEIEVPMF